MSVLVVGISHRSAPVQVLERAAVGATDVPKLLDELLRATHVSEAVLLSTCNRIEVYAVVDAFHGGLADVSAVLARHAGMPLGELTENLYVHYAGSAVQHLFAVASGLDSMVVGEAQILGQLRTAYATADAAGTVGRVLHELAQQALRVGKRVHANTGIDAAGASVVSEALADAEAALNQDPVPSAGSRAHVSTAQLPADHTDELPEAGYEGRPAGAPSRNLDPSIRAPGSQRGALAGRHAVIVGAGAMGALAAAHLRYAGAAGIVVLNRSVDRAQRLADNTLAQGTPARAAGLDALAVELAGADLLVACTGAVGTVVELEPVAAAVAGREGRPLAVCDLGLPRDVDPAVAALPGVTVIDLVALQRRLASGERGAAVAAAQELVADEGQAYLAAQRSAEVTPTVTALRKRASEVIDAELLRLDSRLPDIDTRVREEFDRSVRRVVDKLLHTPTVQVKRLAEGPDGDSYAAALRALFELDPQTPAAVAIQRSGDVLAALEARSDAPGASPITEELDR